ncbi:hypothetical protein ACQJBY_073720 [Aegilops geniculata]
MATPCKEQHFFRITLFSNSKSLNDLDKVCSDVVKAAKEKQLVRVKGCPPRCSTSPQGSHPVDTWDRFEMRVHKRVVHLIGSPDVVKQFPITIPPSVHVEVTITDL